jgi:hypothetical protein
VATATQAADWTFYRKDLAGTANAGEPLTLDQARALEVTRSIFLGGSIFSNPVVANGNLYYTAGSGYLHAVDLSNYTARWQKAIYATGPFHCLSSAREPPVGAPAVVGTTVFVPGGDGVVYSFDSSGRQNWATKIANVAALGEFLWSSIFPLNGKLYVGVSSLHDCLLVPGRLVALDQATGAVVGTWWGDANHQPGAGIWTQPAYDAVSNRLFVTTGTIASGKTPAQQPWADAFVAIDPDRMVTLDSFAPLPGDTFSADNDFGASPTLYDSVDGRHFIAATNKNGWVYALNRDNLAAGIVWKYQISGPGASPDFGESSIVSAPYANGTLFVAGGRTADLAHPGAIAALDAFTGAQKWIFYPDGFVLAAMTVTGQVLFAGTTDAATGRGKLYALDQATGAVVFQLVSASVFGEPTWANGALYVGDAVGLMYELVPNPLGPQPDFDLAMDQLYTRTISGGTATASVSAVPKNGFNAPVSLTVTTPSATPALDPATLSPTPGTGRSPYTSSLSLATSASISTLFEKVAVTGSGGGRTRSTAVWLMISDFALSATAASAVQGSSASSNVTVAPKNGFASPVSLSVSGLPAGTTASFNPSQATTTSTLALQTSSSTPPGTYQVQVSGTVGSLTHTCTLPLTVAPPPDFQVAVAPSSQQAVSGGQASYTVTVPLSGAFSQPVTLSVTGLPPGATGLFGPPQGNAQVLTVTLAPHTAPGLWIFSVLATGGGLTRVASASLTVLAEPDFDLTLARTSARVEQGRSASVSVSVSPKNGFTASVQLKADGLPSGSTASWSAQETASNSTLTIDVGRASALGTYPVTVVGTGAGVSHSAQVSIEIVPSAEIAASARAGCATGGSAGLAAALLGFFVAARLSRRRHGAQPCAALESSVLSE